MKQNDFSLVSFLLFDIVYQRWILTIYCIIIYLIVYCLLSLIILSCLKMFVILSTTHDFHNNGRTTQPEEGFIEIKLVWYLRKVTLAQCYQHRQKALRAPYRVGTRDR